VYILFHGLLKIQFLTQVLNPVLILLFIPLFDKVIYPLLNKCGLLRKPLQRLTVGGLLAGIAFIASGMVELELEVSFGLDITNWYW
jgi:solute carrier family 15 oligopeptide transporter 1